MNQDSVKKLIIDAFPDATVEVNGDGCNFEVKVISKQFEGLSLVDRQKSVYKAVTPHIQSGELHALTIKAKTPEEYQS